MRQEVFVPYPPEHEGRGSRTGETRHTGIFGDQKQKKKEKVIFVDPRDHRIGLLVVIVSLFASKQTSCMHKDGVEWYLS